MEEQIKRLTEMLLEKNDQLSYMDARTWVELLWEDFEATRAKAGREYQGKEMTERIVEQWIQHYGPRLHELAQTHPQYKKWFEHKQFFQ
ncbi:YfhJ family protein [Alkalicoccus urumqiensis]|uniref:WVELL protein n=1 Tax=Alkalicoccus urumqiensis TaxID=1548213 RepID=A0A2P6MGR6_ALKUR|nr:YfhJ family protein [Alkalicoccus urumqiensis]PRO65474.1 hypothetical protein C6I21_09985 [Alkalicoccus urumqiensis]